MRIRRTFMVAALAGLGGISLGDGSPSHPNVLILLADDLGWNGVGFHDPAATTPQLNRLAKEGTELQRFYTYPVCSPARAAILTGQMPRRFGIVDALGPQQAGLPADAITLPAAFRAAGYQTSLIGKWHLGAAHPPAHFGFDHFYGFLGPELDYFKHTNQRGVADWQRDGTNVQEEGYTTYLMADEAIRQLKGRDPWRPFFMEVAFNAPHVPLAAPADLVAKHGAQGGDIGLYAAVLEALDIAVGRILAAVEENGLGSNTLVVFCSDNGGAPRFSSNAPLSRGKDTVNEGGIRTPCVMRWPGQIPSNSVSQQAVSVHDLFPTLAAAAGVPVPAGASFDGSSQWSALREGSVRAREPILIASHDLALIDGDWKLIEWDDGRRSLYNVRADVGETSDELVRQPEIAKRLIAKLAGLAEDLPPAGERRARPGRPPISPAVK